MIMADLRWDEGEKRGTGGELLFPGPKQWAVPEVLMATSPQAKPQTVTPK